MSKWHAVLTAVAAVHLFLVACGAAGLTLLPEDTPSEKLLRLYGELSGADNNFGFFAPRVGAQIRAIFTLTDSDGNTWTDVLERGSNRETDLRVEVLIESVLDDNALEDEEDEDEEGDEEDEEEASRPSWLQTASVKSWAVWMFARHPSAVEVAVSVEYYYVPPMDEYRTGARPEWRKTRCQKTFVRDEEDSSDEGDSDDRD
jgi:hypothetical protein